MPKNNLMLFSLVAVSLILIIISEPVAIAEGSLNLKAEQHWETYGTGGTCISGQHNLFVADVDKDGVEEILTGGWSYDASENGTRLSGYAPLKIWSWDGKSGNVFLEHTEKWTGNIGVVYAADADGDGNIEIITSGSFLNGSRYSGTLRFWSWDGKALLHKGTYDGVSAGSLIVMDVDMDSVPEIVTVENPFNRTAQLVVWRWNGENLSLNFAVDCCDSVSDSVSSVAAGDLDNDGTAEIVTAGYANILNDSKGQVRVWKLVSGSLSFGGSAEWRLVDGFALNSAGNVQGNTLVSNVKVEDVDGDGEVEILTGGFTFDGEKVAAQLRIWNWTEKTLQLEENQEWVSQDITELKTIFVSDVDGDGKVEIVTSGGAVGYGSFAANSTEKEEAQLRVWGWDGQTLKLKEGEDWVIGEGVMAWNVAAGDLNGDGVNEIVTVGCMYIGNLCDPDLRVWSVSSDFSLSSLSIYVVASVAFVIVVVVAVFALIFVRKRRQLRSTVPFGT